MTNSEYLEIIKKANKKDEYEPIKDWTLESQIISGTIYYE